MSSRKTITGVMGAVLLCGVIIVAVHGHRGPLPTVKRSTMPLGFYVGEGQASLLTDAASATGTHPTLAEDFLPGSNGWSGMINARPLRYLLDGWLGSGYRLVLGVPIIPTSAGAPVGTLATGATGSYDNYFRTLAQSLVAKGEGNAILRLGWEFNGNWETWSVLNPTDAANYAEFFRQIVTTMRSVSPHFQYVWNLSDGSGSASDLTAAYPGNAYVDYVGDDVYDESCAAVPSPAAAWRSFLTAHAGLNWVAAFAADHDKPLAIPEWGIDSGRNGACGGLGDDPYFIDRMAAWLTAHRAGFSIYFDFDAPDGSHRLQDGSFPKSLAAFQQAF
jgi:hypothetical protein